VCLGRLYFESINVLSERRIISRRDNYFQWPSQKTAMPHNSWQAGLPLLVGCSNLVSFSPRPPTNLDLRVRFRYEFAGPEFLNVHVYLGGLVRVVCLCHIYSSLDLGIYI
jgi:hypothetical protein